MDIEQSSCRSEYFDQSPIMQGTFYVGDENSQTEVKLVLTNKHLKVLDSQGQLCMEPIELNHDVSYKLFVHHGYQKIHQLQITTNQKIYKFTTLIDLSEWNQVLIKLIARAQFHDLVKGSQRLGKGSFAAVYKGIRLYDQKLFAIKAFSKNQLIQKNNMDGLQNQIDILRKINHPNLCGLEAVLTSENSIYLLIDYINGVSLHDYLKQQRKQKPLGYEIRVKIMRAILSGLAQLARIKVVHRDIKPENVMIDKETKQVKIIDFGLSTFTEIQNYLYVRCGTPGYVAPQILRISDVTTARMNSIADVFSAGCIYYQLIFNRPLFDIKKNNQIIAMNRQCNIMIPDYCSNITVTQQQLFLVRRMLEANPQERITASQALELPPFTQISNMRDEEQDCRKSITNTMATSIFSSGISNGSSMYSSGLSNMQTSLARNVHHNRPMIKKPRKMSEQVHNKQNIY